MSPQDYNKFSSKATPKKSRKNDSEKIDSLILRDDQKLIQNLSISSDAILKKLQILVTKKIDDL